jgi:hypothetical protein
MQFKRGPVRVTMCALVLAASTTVAVGATASASPDGADTSAPAEFGVTLGSDEPLEHAIVELVADRPDQYAVIKPVLAQMREAARTAPLRAQGQLLDEAAFNRLDAWLEAERVARGSGLVQAEKALGAAQPLAPSARLLASPSFEGMQNLNHIRCGTSGCTVVSTVTHHNIMDLAYTWYASTARVTSSATGWSGLSAVANCRVLAGPRPSCAGPNSLSVSKITFTRRTFNYTRTPDPGQFTVTFSGVYAGIPGTVSGNTPTTYCDIPNRMCYFR